MLLRMFAGPKISVDTIDHAIVARYELILTTLEWKGIEQEGILRTKAAYGAGSIAATQGCKTVAGIGTNWSGAYSGWQLFVGDGPLYTVTITGPSTLELDRPFEGCGGGAAGYWIAQAIYELPDNCRNLRAIFPPYGGASLAVIDEDIFGELEGACLPINAATNSVTNYIPWTDGVNAATGATVQRILLFPVPVLAQGYPLKYDAVSDAFNGDSTSAGPLAFVSAAALIAGCKADLEAEKTAPRTAMIEKFEADFDKWLTGMIHIENGKRPKQRIRIDESYTQHRTQRYLRSAGGLAILRDALLDSGDALTAAPPTLQTDTFIATGNSLFTLSAIPISTPLVLVNNVLATAGTYVQAGTVLNFLAGSIPAVGAIVTVIYNPAPGSITATSFTAPTIATPVNPGTPVTPTSGMPFAFDTPGAGFDGGVWT
jgi:hypothetical protein